MYDVEFTMYNLMEPAYKIVLHPSEIANKESLKIK